MSDLSIFMGVLMIAAILGVCVCIGDNRQYYNRTLSAGVVFWAVVALGAGASCVYGFTDEHKQNVIEADRQQAANDLAERTPHVIRQADGCKVYAFKSGEMYHYFTRCPNATTVTDRTYEECTGSGKHRHCEMKVEQISEQQ